MAAVPQELEAIIRHFPRFWSEAGHLFTQTLYESVKLDRKTIELILLSLLAGRRWETGIKVHTAAALQHGATPDEIRGAILLSMAVFSTSSAASGLHWAEPILAETEPPAPTAKGKSPQRARLPSHTGRRSRA
jgi:alkylhydroperoxidase/carboxymuconolactone decarboxylase family protein YurZ